jgi:biotin carboxylase
VVVGCGFPQLGLLRAARELGVPTLGFDLNPHAVGVSLVDRFLPVSTGDADAVVQAAREEGARGITTTGSELALATTAAAAVRLDLPFYADPATVYRCQEKSTMRAAYEAAGLPVPAFARPADLAAAYTFCEQFGYPVVVKPAQGWGQRGVSRVSEASELPAAFERAARVSHGGAGVVLEQFLVGRELSVNGWVEDGELVAYGVTDREVFPGAAPLGVMRSEVAPSEQGRAAEALAVDAATRAARALGLTRGPCYTQVCVADGRAIVFETAARCGGGFDADVTFLVSGVDLYRRLLGVALDDPQLEREGPRATGHGAALVRFVAPPVGVVESVEGVAEARGLPGVVDAAVYAQPGQRLGGLVNAASRVAHLLVTGSDRAEAVARADEAESRLRIRVRSAEG